MIAYFNGQYLEKDEITVSPDDRGFLFSDGIYEVVRFYNNKPFRIDEHQKRMEDGARALRFNRDSFPEFGDIARQLQVKNNLLSVESTIVYFQITRGVAPRSHSFPKKETPLTIYSFTREFPGNINEQIDGAHAITVTDTRWSRCDIKSISLLANTLAHQAARDHGAVEALFIRENIVQEGSHSNIGIYANGIIKTAPISNFILEGITRRAVLELCNALHIPFSEEPISKEDLYNAEEVFIVGTTVEITPIIRIDDRDIGKKRPGSVTRDLQNAFRKLVIT